MMNEKIIQASTSVPDLTYYPDKLTKYPQFLEKN